jgi:nucleoside-diphosphate-sugar epimerase
MLANSQGTYHLLELARANAARFLLASTSEAYGDPLEHPQRETYWGNVNPNGERACYDESKRFAEALTFVYWRSHGLDARIIRIFNTYGPHSDPADGRVVPNFISQALRGEPLTIYGAGTQTRALCYVDDLVDGIARAMFSSGSRGEVFNLGNPDERTIRELAEVINHLCGNRSELVFRPYISADDPQRRCPDITKARDVLGWEPRVALEAGLARTIAWFRERLGLVLVHR